jgi:squalene-associated FAD-dependent desaturase
MSAPARAVVIGGGFAGVASAVELSRRGWRVTLVEARRKAGGRATSFVDPESGETIDNGQHLLMGCYTATRELLHTLGTSHLVRFQKRLSITMIEEGGRTTRLSCPPLPSPAHLLAGLLTFKGLTLADKAALLRCAPRLMKENGNGMTVEGWLDALGQTENLRERFWRPLAVAALNEATAVAGAELLTGVLRVAFGQGASGSGLGFPRAGLSDLHAEPAAAWLGTHGGELLTGTAASGIDIAAGRASAVVLRDGTRLECDAVVLAVPHTAVAELLPSTFLDADPKLARASDLGLSAIASVNIWYDRRVTELGFFGQIGGTVQFVFNKSVLWDQSVAKGSYLACVISAASGLKESTKEEIAQAAVEELGRYIPATRAAKVLRTMVVREKQATFSGRPDLLWLRPGSATALPNLALAGDWTDTGLPGTIEGAVRSGVAAAGVITAT